LKSTLDTLLERRHNAQVAQGRMEGLVEALKKTKERQARLQAEVTALPEIPRLEALDEALQACDAEVRVLSMHIEGVGREVTRLETSYAFAVRMYETEKARGEELRNAVVVIEKELATLSFNNALLKKIRTIRPRVADQLWNQILATVSHIFSRLRGEEAVLVKDKDGFRCNGEVVESLSGSALDMLGLAIRATLCKVFLPHLSCIVLDEPAAACNMERTTRLLGFLASAGFEQILMVTHEELSETFADALITLD
jgi:DNA repair exonuclease SbcCD ATPase subunit